MATVEKYNAVVTGFFRGSLIYAIVWHPEKSSIACCEDYHCYIIQYDDIKDHLITNSSLSVSKYLNTKNAARKILSYKSGAAWSSNGSYLVTGPENQFRDTNFNNIAFHFNEGDISHEVHNPTNIRPYIIKISKKNDIAFADTTAVGFYNNKTKQITKLEEYGRVTAIQFDAAGNYLAVVNYDDLFIWDVEKRTVCAHHQCQFRIQTLAWLSQYRELITYKDTGSTLVGLTFKKLMPMVTSSKDTEIENNK